MPDMTVPGHPDVVVRAARPIVSRPVGHFLSPPPVTDNNRTARVALLVSETTAR